jgi:capsule polysaccharide export protein KpsE/RkpR
MQGSLGNIASAMGAKIGMGGSTDAIYPQFYPDIISSTSFLVSLFNINVRSSDGKISASLYDYCAKYQKSPWWSILDLKFLFNKPSKGIKKGITPFNLTESQNNIAMTIKNMISCSVDRETSVITLKVTCQDAMISAVLADSVRVRLQEFITDYRTNKARNDLAYMQNLYEESKAQYVKAQQLYASYADANQDLMLESFKAKENSLENEMQLQYNIYTQVAQQLQAAKAKVQEKTPVYAVLQPATVPLLPSAPHKSVIVVVCLLIAVFVITIWIMVADTVKSLFHDKKKDEDK